MTFDWRLVLGLADELAQRQDEVAHRSAISRAYYSAFCYARDRAGLNTADIRDSHRTVFDFYRLRANAKLRDFGNNELPALHRKRKEADYDEEAVINAGQARLTVARAKKIMDFLGQLKKEDIDKRK